MGSKELRDNDEMEIDLIQLLLALKQRIWAILAAAVICGAIAGAYTKLVMTPQYRSTAMVYILSKETTLTSLADLQIGSQLTKDYKVIVTSRPVLEDVIQQMNLSLNYNQLKNKITIDNPTDTRILSITVEDPDPLLAKELVDAVAQTSSEYIGDIMEMVPPKTIEQGAVATHQSSPSTQKNVMMGALIGIVLVCGLVTLEFILNDTIKTEEDVERYLGISVLASVPKREDENLKDKEAEAKNRSSKKKGNSKKSDSQKSNFNKKKRGGK